MYNPLTRITASELLLIFTANKLSRGVELSKSWVRRLQRVHFSLCFSDEGKKKQLLELAIINGTYTPRLSGAKEHSDDSKESKTSQWLPVFLLFCTCSYSFTVLFYIRQIKTWIVMLYVVLTPCLRLLVHCPLWTGVITITGSEWPVVSSSTCHRKGKCNKPVLPLGNNWHRLASNVRPREILVRCPSAIM